MNDESSAAPLMDDSSTPLAVRRLLGSATAPSGIPQRALRAGRSALAEGLRPRPAWRMAYLAVGATLLAGGAAVAATQPAWLQQLWRRGAVERAQGMRAKPAAPGQIEAAPVTPPAVAPVPSRAVGSASGPSASSTAGRLPSAAPTPLDTSLEAEVAALRAARAELASNPARALSLSRAHAGRFPSARLAAEARLLEVEALVRLGRREEAQRAGQLLLAAPGASLYRERIETLLGASNR